MDHRPVAAGAARLAMNVFRTLESKIAGLVEGTFGRVFRSEVRPMELAHKLVREMDSHRTISVSRVVRARTSTRSGCRQAIANATTASRTEVIDELCAYLLEHARREGLVLASRPSIAFHTDPELALGEFGIETRLASPPGLAVSGERRPRAARRHAVAR